MTPASDAAIQSAINDAITDEWDAVLRLWPRGQGAGTPLMKLLLGVTKGNVRYDTKGEPGIPEDELIRRIKEAVLKRRPG